MKEFINKLIGRLEELKTYYAEDFSQGYSCEVDCVEKYEVKKIVNELAEEYINTSTDTSTNSLDASTNTSSGWIPCSERLPEMPKENPLFEYKPLELYLVSLSSTDYPWRAFWNGKYFTDGFSKVEPIAWMPLPAPYKEGE